jgi:hypothetical protein
MATNSPTLVARIGVCVGVGVGVGVGIGVGVGVGVGLGVAVGVEEEPPLHPADKLAKPNRADRRDKRINHSNCAAGR